MSSDEREVMEATESLMVNGSASIARLPWRPRANALRMMRRAIAAVALPECGTYSVDVRVGDDAVSAQVVREDEEVVA